MILKLSGFLLAMEVEGPYMHPNQRLILIQKWYGTRDIQLTRCGWCGIGVAKIAGGVRGTVPPW